MSTTFIPENVQSSLDSFEKQYNEQPEPTQNGVSHAPAKMTVQLKGFATRELPAKEDKPGYTILTLTGEVISPENTAPAGQLPNGRTEFGNNIAIEQFLSEGNPVGAKIVKQWARTLGVNTGSFKGDVAGIAEKANAGTFVEVQTKHRTDKKGETRMDVFLNREVTA